MTEPRLSARGITVRFGGITALDGVDLDVPAASTVGLVGPNGAGKSTLFSVLSGLRRPNAGRVFLDGLDVTASTPQSRARAGLARTFQHPELFSGLTVREHVTLAYRLKHTPLRVWTDPLTAGGFRRPRAEERDRVDQLLSGLRLQPLADRTVRGLPLGSARVVEIARALAREPSVLLLDEASSGLDVAETEELAEVLRRVVAERGISVLMVEHDVDLVLRLSDQVCVLDFGARIAHGTPAEIRADPIVRAAYLGENLEEAR
ncbi:ABC transporter ATP-binding protein [Cryptosporangium aurantiacum]|uniref:Amino acid/amide ABC transporter ATP-binding protein 1, HAAT family n=1 Tax=Cryptosporangium aurantiacum TaxID=134849 RepID=A0A1M7PI07_9ACTN|nr:ABC transporter ATP-binding protein [Cryptosporangium aurantiacum]SHN16743.1 amino acid/amide ABC transporter ATP-binding protein 1, HAAT family [Cryptosporangium aurantiacum]